MVGVNTQNTPVFCARGTAPCYATACCITWCINCCITCIITYSITCGNTCCINCITCSSTCCIAWSITFINVVSLVVSPAVSPVLSPLPPVVSTALSPVLSLVVSPAVSGVAWVSDAWVDLKFAAPPHVQSHIFLAHSYEYFWRTFFLNIKFFPPPCASFRSIKVFSYPENFSKPYKFLCAAFHLLWRMEMQFFRPGRTAHFATPLPAVSPTVSPVVSLVVSPAVSPTASPLSPVV